MRTTRAIFAAVTLTVVLAACSSGGTTPGSGGQEAPSGATQTTQSGAASSMGTVTIEDNHGTVEVPVNPQRVVALDNHVFQLLTDWGVDLVAAPKGIMGKGLWPNYTDNDQVLDIGTHREPNMEAVVAAQPDLIIGGYRFGDAYEDLKAQNPQAAVIELEPRKGEDQATELKRQVTLLGKIFERTAEADQVNAKLDAAIASARGAYNGTDTVVGLITSGGEISYSAPVTGRSIGVLYPTLGLKPAIEQEAEDTSHGDDISVEAIAQANPDWIVVLDRDASGVASDGFVPAKELIEGSEALAGVTAVKKGQIIHLDPNFYLTEDIHAYTGLYQQLSDAFTQAS